MDSWSQRRKLIYGGTTILVVVALVTLSYYRFLYQAPTCNDGKQNGTEAGTDCGGACERLCASSFLAPVASWTRFEQNSPGLYNIAAYIVNPNVTGEAKNVPYRIVLYDGKGELVTSVKGTVTLAPHRNTLAFLPAVFVGSHTPSKSVFEFTAVPDWYKVSDQLSGLAVTSKTYNESKTGSALTVNLKNNGLNTLSHIGVSAVLYDKNSNTVGFSKTLIDEIGPNGTAVAPFTWPASHNGQVISIEVLPVAE